MRIRRILQICLLGIFVGHLEARKCKNGGKEVLKGKHVSLIVYLNLARIVYGHPVDSWVCFMKNSREDKINGHFLTVVVETNFRLELRHRLFYLELSIQGFDFVTNIFVSSCLLTYMFFQRDHKTRFDKVRTVIWGPVSGSLFCLCEKYERLRILSNHYMNIWHQNQIGRNDLNRNGSSPKWTVLGQSGRSWGLTCWSKRFKWSIIY